MKYLLLSTVDFENSVTISSSGLAIAGGTFSLTCSATLVNPIPLPANVPSPSFEWFFGPNSNVPLPSIVTHVETALDGSYKIYESTLQFSHLNQSHSGTYTCKLGGGRLANSSVVSVYCKFAKTPPLPLLYTVRLYCIQLTNPISIYPVGVVDIITSGSPMLGQNYTLTCMFFAICNPCSDMLYQWTKNNGTLVQLETETSTLSFSLLKLSDAGQYTCQAIIYFSDGITVSATGSQDIRLESERNTQQQ